MPNHSLRKKIPFHQQLADFGVPFLHLALYQTMWATILPSVMDGVDPSIHPGRKIHA